MRQIKFRAWNEHMNFMEEPRDLFEIPSSWDSDFMILMQYTGVKDKNGKEIYEGDIIKANDKHNIWNIDGDYSFGIVVFNNAEWQLTEDRGGYNNCAMNLFTMKKDFKIIGNIYENPELLI